MRLIILFLALSLTGYGQSVIKVDAKKRTFAGSTIGINTMGTVFEAFDIPAPETNLVGYWSASYGIEADSTIILVNTNDEPVDTIKLIGVDFSLSAGYIPLKTAATFTMQSSNTIDTAFWNHPIYPTTVFQNIDYDSTTYFKVASHVLNADSTELHPARITEIAIYSTATDANSYFDVPTIAKTGIRMVGVGQTYETIQAAIDAATVGDTIYIKSKTYTENVATYGGINIAKNSLALIGLGRVELKAAGGYPIRIATSAGNITISGININGIGKTYAVRPLTGGDSIKFLNCRIIGDDYVFNNTTASNAVLFVKDSYIGGYCQFNGKVDYISNYVTPMGENYAISIQAVKTFSFQYNDIKKFGLSFFSPTATSTINFNYNNSGPLVWVSANVICNFNSRGNHYVRDVASRIVSTDVSSIGNFNFYNDYFDQTFATYGEYIAVRNAKNITIDSCRFNVNGSIIIEGVDTSANYQVTKNYSNNTKDLAFSLRNVDSLTFTYNNFNGNTFTSEVYNIEAYISDYGLFGYNRIVSSSDSTPNVPILIGKSGTGFNGNNSGYTVIGNYIDQKYSHSGIFFDRNYNGIAKYNWLKNTSIGVTCKGDGEKFNTVLSYNIVEGTLPKLAGLLAKGADSVYMYHNTINLLQPNYGIQIGDNEDVGDDSSAYCKVYNNIVNTGNGTAFSIGNNSLSTLLSDYNVFYTSGTKVLVQPSTTYTLAQWIALGRDENSLNVTPNFTSSTQLWPVTQFNGTNLGDGYKNGLGITTLWPTVVTKQQGATWQIGAYVK